MRIWIKAMTNDRIIKETTIEGKGQQTKQRLYEDLRAGCEAMDIPCPMVLNSHFRNLWNYRIAKFSATDFVETIPFDQLIIEDITD